ncbi:LysR family transcriptional regulator [Virgibacillus sediminis]|uniref:LysR family transcriptional regulator n=1 Tax=Virgibacillus sediminis TaxID=202260 RepID=A0ABV7A3S1_9BACI
MEIRQLKYFLTIVEEGSFSGAAKKLHMTQPPISQQLKILEDELNVSLIERTTKKVVTTDAGELLYQRAKEVLDLLDLTAEEVRELREGISGTLSIGAITSLASELLPEKIQHFKKMYPKVNFQIHEGDPNRIMELLENRNIELGITRLPVNTQVFDMIRLPEEPMIAVMNKQWDISNKFPYINLSNLEDKPLMLLRRLQGTSSYNDTVEPVKDSFRTLGYEPTIITESDNIATLLNWAYHGIGIAIVPKSAKNLIPYDEIIYKEIINPSIKTRPSGIIWRKKGYLSTVSRKFLEYFKA